MNGYDSKFKLLYISNNFLHRKTTEYSVRGVTFFYKTSLLVLMVFLVQIFIINSQIYLNFITQKLFLSFVRNRFHTFINKSKAKISNSEVHSLRRGGSIHTELTCLYTAVSCCIIDVFP